MTYINKKSYITIAVLSALSSISYAQHQNTNNVNTSANIESNALLAAEKGNISNTLNASPTLKKIRDTGIIKVGYRSVAPVSYDVGGKATGYAIDLCNEGIEEIKSFLDMRALKVEYVQLTSVQRMPFLQEGKIDLECGVTTNTADRRNTTNFSIPYFITGTKMLINKANVNTFKSINDLTGLPVATVKSTTAVKTIDTLNKQRLLNIKNNQYDNYELAIESVIKGETKAMLLDEIILEDLKLKSSNPGVLTTSGDFISVEPLAVMMRKEKPLQDLINKRFVNLIQSGQFENYYQKWFKRAVPPDGLNYNLDMSPGLREVLRFPNDIVGN